MYNASQHCFRNLKMWPRGFFGHGSRFLSSARWLLRSLAGSAVLLARNTTFRIIVSRLNYRKVRIYSSNFAYLPLSSRVYYATTTWYPTPMLCYSSHRKLHITSLNPVTISLPPIAPPIIIPRTLGRSINLLCRN